MTWKVRLPSSSWIRNSRLPTVSTTHPARVQAALMEGFNATATPWRETGASVGNPLYMIVYSPTCMVPSPFHLVSDWAMSEKLWSAKSLHRLKGLSGAAPVISSSPFLLSMVECKVRTLSAPQRKEVVWRFQAVLLIQRRVAAFTSGRWQSWKLEGRFSCKRLCARKKSTPACKADAPVGVSLNLKFSHPKMRVPYFSFSQTPGGCN